MERHSASPYISKTLLLDWPAFCEPHPITMMWRGKTWWKTERLLVGQEEEGMAVLLSLEWWRWPWPCLQAGREIQSQHLFIQPCWWRTVCSDVVCVFWPHSWGLWCHWWAYVSGLLEKSCVQGKPPILFIDMCVGWEKNKKNDYSPWVTVFSESLLFLYSMVVGIYWWGMTLLFIVCILVLWWAVFMTSSVFPSEAGKLCVSFPRLNYYSYSETSPDIEVSLPYSAISWHTELFQAVVVIAQPLVPAPVVVTYTPLQGWD